MSGLRVDAIGNYNYVPMVYPTVRIDSTRLEQSREILRRQAMDVHTKKTISYYNMLADKMNSVSALNYDSRGSLVEWVVAEYSQDFKA